MWDGFIWFLSLPLGRNGLEDTESVGTADSKAFPWTGMVVRCLLIEISIFLFRSRLEVKTLVRVKTLITGFAATRRLIRLLSTQYQPFLNVALRYLQTQWFYHQELVADIWSSSSGRFQGLNARGGILEFCTSPNNCLESCQTDVMMDRDYDMTDAQHQSHENKVLRSFLVQPSKRSWNFEAKSQKSSHRCIRVANIRNATHPEVQNTESQFGRCKCRFAHGERAVH